jgi:protein SCO1/2
LLLLWLAVLLIFVGGMTMWGAWRLFQRETDGLAGSGPGGSTASANLPATPPPGSGEKWIDEFTLTERSGETFDSRDLAGKVWVASFFFASCPSYCVQQNQYVKHLHDDLANQDVTFVSITCDPKHDTPEKLREYARKFDADPQRWLFLTGDLTYIRRIGAEKFSQPVHEQTHKNALIAVDKWGTPRGSFDWNDDAEKKELRELLATLQQETENPADEAGKSESVAPETSDSPAITAEESAETTTGENGSPQ